MEISKKFSQEMKKGKVNSAMKSLSDDIKNGILSLTKQTLYQLQLKEILLPDKPKSINPIKFEDSDVQKIQKAAIRTKVVHDFQA